MTSEATQSVAGIPGYIAGTWDIDAAHTDISFSVRHMMVSKVRGRFNTFSGVIVTAPEPSNSTVEVEIELASVDTANEQRDEHLRSGDFFETESNKVAAYKSSSVKPDGDGWILDGELTLRGVTLPVPLKFELNGVGPDPYGGTRIGFSAKGELNRGDFGVSFNAALEGGGLVVGDKVQLAFEVEAVLRKD